MLTIKFEAFLFLQSSLKALYLRELLNRDIFQISARPIDSLILYAWIPWCVFTNPLKVIAVTRITRPTKYNEYSHF